MCHFAFTSREPFCGQSGCTVPGAAVGSSEGRAVAAAVDAVVGASEAAGLVDAGAGDATIGVVVGTSKTAFVTSVGAEVASMAVGAAVGGWLAAGATVIGYVLTQAPPV
jgi:hypothetical protein